MYVFIYSIIISCMICVNIVNVGMLKPTSTAWCGITHSHHALSHYEKLHHSGLSNQISVIPPMTAAEGLRQIGTADHQLLVLEKNSWTGDDPRIFFGTVFAVLKSSVILLLQWFRVYPSVHLWSPLHHPDHWSNTSVFKGKVPTASIMFEQNRSGFEKTMPSCD